MLKQIKIKRNKFLFSISALFFILSVIILVLMVDAYMEKVEMSSDNEEFEYFSVTGRHVADEVIVRFRKGYIPSELQVDMLEGERNKLNPFRQTINLFKSRMRGALGILTASERMATISNSLGSKGVISITPVFTNTNVSELSQYYVLKVENISDIDSFQKSISGLSFLGSSEPNTIVSASKTSNDPSFSFLWGMDKIQAPQAWDYVTSSPVIVAVVDSGVDYTHPDLQSIIKGEDFLTCNGFDQFGLNCIIPKERDLDPMDDTGHGTHVAGTIGAVGNNSTGVVGVNWNVQIMAVKALGPNGGSTDDVLAAIFYAVSSDSKVINLSIGINGRCTPSYQSVINEAFNKGIVVVVAAGNDNRDVTSSAPANCENVIAVGATDRNDRRSYYSNFGLDVDLAAPGGDIRASETNGIMSTWIGGGYKFIQGTSMASPHVAGAAALLLSVNPSLTPQQVRDCLVQNGDPITTDKPIGGVRLNIYKAILACTNATPPPGGPPPTNTPTPKLGATNTPTPTLPPGTTATPTPTPTTAPGGVSTPTPTRSVFIPPGTPTPTPAQYFTCVPDPKCANSGNTLQICPLVCTPK